MRGGGFIASYGYGGGNPVWYGYGGAFLIIISQRFVVFYAIQEVEQRLFIVTPDYIKTYPIQDKKYVDFVMTLINSVAKYTMNITDILVFDFIFSYIVKFSIGNTTPEFDMISETTNIFGIYDKLEVDVSVLDQIISDYVISESKTVEFNLTEVDKYTSYRGFYAWR